MMEDAATLSSRDEPKRQSWWKYITVEPVQSLFYLSFMPIEAIVQQYVYAWYAKSLGLPSTSVSHQTSCASNSSDQNYYVQQHVQALVSEWSVWFGVLEKLPTLILILIYGSYSDRVGRKLILLIPITGISICFFFMLVVIYFDLHVRFLWLAAFILGISGGAATVSMTSFAYIADITTKGSRSSRMFILDVVYSLATAFAGIPVGFMIRALGYPYTIVYCLSLQALNIIYVLFYLEESCPGTLSTNTPVSVFHMLKRVWKLYVVEQHPKRCFKLRICFLIDFLFNFSYLGRTPVHNLYLLNTPFCFNSVLLGYYSGIEVGLQKVLPVAPVLVMIRYLGDVWMIIIGLASAMTFQIFTGLSVNTSMVFAVTFIGFFTGPVYPLTMSVMTKTGSHDEHGAILSSVRVALVLGMLISSFVLNPIYSATLYVHRGFVFFFMALLLFIAGLLAGWLKSDERTVSFSNSINNKDYCLKDKN